MHPAWKMYIDFVSGQPGIKFIEMDPVPQWLFWLCLFGFGMLNGALFFQSIPRGVPGMLWRLSSVGIVFAASAGFSVMKFRWAMREVVATAEPDALYSTQMVPVLSVFLPAALRGVSRASGDPEAEAREDTAGLGG
ncbi:hypothetical protein DES53_11669 [Roseimicrobium gellanilyticum]|uniref:Uncharacterized protein n=1 Tax=Roseimicrobium gellanilyticum TaxID=748857 RepID=A0A366H3T0_9BACT|nr:hypothetical protein [Roseimicrobium gellanilyticum]RBP36630.1 hypothetical protein DES53_11669 [Roseimicrobium gellanilyticum]